MQLSSGQVRAMRELRANGWSVAGITRVYRRYRLTEASVRMLLGEDRLSADWPGMPLISALEAEAEKVFRAVEARVEEFDGQALAEARRLLAEARTAEGQVLSLILTNKAQVLALVQQYGPEVVAAVEAVLKDLLTEVQGLFGLPAPE